MPKESPPTPPATPPQRYVVRVTPIPPPAVEKDPNTVLLHARTGRR